MLSVSISAPWWCQVINSPAWSKACWDQRKTTDKWYEQQWSWDYNALGCWETVGPSWGCYLTHSTHLNIITDQVNPLKVTSPPMGPTQPWKTWLTRPQTPIWNGLRNMTKRLGLWFGLQAPQTPIQWSFNGIQRNRQILTEAPSLQEQNDPLPLSRCLWWHVTDQYNISLVVLMWWWWW